jgi:hypothetical protein
MREWPEALLRPAGEHLGLGADISSNVLTEGFLERGDPVGAETVSSGKKYSD